MGKVLELSEETCARLLGLTQQRQCASEELIHTFVVAYEQAQYAQANQPMLARGILASLRRPLGGVATAYISVDLPGLPRSRPLLDARR